MRLIGRNGHLSGTTSCCDLFKAHGGNAIPDGSHEKLWVENGPELNLAEAQKFGAVSHELLYAAQEEILVALSLIGQPVDVTVLLGIATVHTALGKNSGALPEAIRSYARTLLYQCVIDFQGGARNLLYATKRPHGGILVVYWERELPWVSEAKIP